MNLTTNPLECQGNDEVATIWLEQRNGSALIASFSGSPGFEQGQEFGKQFLAAYKGTYGKGINPEAVEMLLKIAQDIEYHLQKQSVKSKWSRRILSNAQAAIEKATIR